MKYKSVSPLTFLFILGLSGCCCKPLPNAGYTSSPDYTVVNEPIVETDPMLQQYSSNTVITEPGLYEKKELASTRSYHPKIMPQTAHQSDREWVSSQPANGYTIQVAKHAEPSQVAKVLYQAPKTAHVAEVATTAGYVGVFGSYHSQEEAMQALQTLPEGLRKEAKVTPWNQIRSLE